MGKLCPNCGSPLKEGAKFCDDCGNPVAVEPKKNKRSKTILLLVLIAVVALIAIWYFTSSGGSLNGKGYAIELPENTDNVKCEQVSEEKMAEMNANGYQFVSRPVMVTQNGDEHVQLDQMAKVSFDIPKDVPKEEYINLMGVLVTDEGPVYMIPDIMELKNGVASFETSHFCIAGLTKMEQEKRREEFIKRTAASEWQAGMSDKDLEKSVKQTLLDAASDIGFGERDLMGIAAREVLADNDFVKTAVDMIEAYDSSNGDPETMAKKAAEKIEEAAKAKLLAILFEKLKGDMEKDLVDYDPKSGKFIHTKVTVEGKYKGYIEELEKHLGQENMEDLGTRLGQGDNPLRIAWDYAKAYRTQCMKDFAVKMVPQIKMIQAAATTMKILKEFWASNEINDLFEIYRKYADSNGQMKDDDWNTLVFRKLNAAKSKYGMTEWEIRQQFIKRMQNDRDIRKREAELRKMIALYEDTDRYTLINAKIFDEKGFDYIQRLTRIHMLVERFRAELVVNGVLPGKSRGKTIDETLCEIVAKFLEYYPDTQKFYQWVAQNGYYGEKLKKDLDHLNEFRSWWLVGVTIEKRPDVSDEHSIYYSASETQHQSHHSWNGEKFQDLNDPNGEIWYCPYDITFACTLSEAPPEWMEGGDTLVLHATIQVSGEETAWFMRQSASLNFDKEDVGMGGTYTNNFAQAINLNGSRDVGSRYGEAKYGEWDFVLRIPNGRKDALYAVNFDACGCRTHWIYKWASMFEKDE